MMHFWIYNPKYYTLTCQLDIRWALLNSIHNLNSNFFGIWMVQEKVLIKIWVTLYQFHISHYVLRKVLENISRKCSFNQLHMSYHPSNPVVFQSISRYIKFLLPGYWWGERCKSRFGLHFKSFVREFGNIDLFVNFVFDEFPASYFLVIWLNKLQNQVCRHFIPLSS